jgi:16S rRNA (uracil1498-N3)-methyltransferase
MRFFIPPAPPLKVGDLRTLDTIASTHLVRVLRVQPGQTVRLFDGLAHSEFDARITSAHRERVEVVCTHEVPRSCEAPVSVVLGVALGRHERMDYIIQVWLESLYPEENRVFSHLQSACISE